MAGWRPTERRAKKAVFAGPYSKSAIKNRVALGARSACAVFSGRPRWPPAPVHHASARAPRPCAGLRRSAPPRAGRRGLGVVGKKGRLRRPLLKVSYQKQSCPGRPQRLRRLLRAATLAASACPPCISARTAALRRSAPVCAAEGGAAGLGCGGQKRPSSQAPAQSQLSKTELPPNMAGGQPRWPPPGRGAPGRQPGQPGRRRAWAEAGAWAAPA